MPWRWRRLGLQTLLGLGTRGWFIPYRYAASLPGPGERESYPAIEAHFRAHEPAFLALLGEVERLAGNLEAIGREPPPGPRWNQDWFLPLDAAVAYSMVRLRRPGRIVEIGSGHSTRFLARAVKDGMLETRITAIDPAPRASLEGLGIDIVRKTLHDAGDAAFAGLETGDFVFIDSSHILMPGSDVDHLLGRVLPTLPSGVLVHFHDIYLPDDYPADWAWRGYNEQLGLLGLLQGGSWQIEFASHYCATRLATALANHVVARLRPSEKLDGSSLWLRKR